MIELNNNALVFSFHEVHWEAKMSLHFQRTLRIPDDGQKYPLPSGLGSFPIHHVDDFAAKVPPSWLEHGGVMLPMYQSEAMWINLKVHNIFDRNTAYPFALKIAVGKINAVTGETWTEGLSKYPQNYIVSPIQPWVDGYCVGEGVIRQFVAKPLGCGYSAEEQITMEANYGGMQIEIFPMKRAAFERRFPIARNDQPEGQFNFTFFRKSSDGFDMALAPGGRMRQFIYKDPFSIDDWDLKTSSKCFVHIANSLEWHTITGEKPLAAPFTVKEYREFGFPWFDFYNDNLQALTGSRALENLKSAAEKNRAGGWAQNTQNESIEPRNIIALRNGLKQNQVRETP